jgi:hypothetical protein
MRAISKQVAQPLRSGFKVVADALARQGRVGDAEVTVMEQTPDEKHLQSVSFSVHATRGLLRDQSARRKVMMVLLVVALLLLISGSTFLAGALHPREHMLRALLFWGACVWLTFTALLLALFDLLLVRAQARKEVRRLREEFSDEETPDTPRSK